jgi:hypothetical protein
MDFAKRSGLQLLFRLNELKVLNTSPLAWFPISETAADPEADSILRNEPSWPNPGHHRREFATLNSRRKADQGDRLRCETN